MKRAFIRGLWGNIWHDPKETTDRGLKIAKDINRVTNSKFQADFVTYVFGKDNEIALKNEFGLKTKLVDRSPIVWDMTDELYRHKLEILKIAMQDYDEIVYLDWDCILVKPLLADFWERLNKKDSFQGNLFQYRTKKCLWRDDDLRKVVNGGFLYMRDKTIPDKMIHNWDGLRQWALDIQSARREQGKELRLRERSLMFDDEPSITKYVDDAMDGWKGVDEFWDRFEADVCRLKKKSAYSIDNKEALKNNCFVHML
tara:strand:- start:10007 stop:10774 length:768 start_codon:yes stop_codon:yes gene_type:complete